MWGQVRTLGDLGRIPSTGQVGVWNLCQQTGTWMAVPACVSRRVVTSVVWGRPLALRTQPWFSSLCFSVLIFPTLTVASRFSVEGD